MKHLGKNFLRIAVFTFIFLTTQFSARAGAPTDAQVKSDLLNEDAGIISITFAQGHGEKKVDEWTGLVYWTRGAYCEYKVDPKEVDGLTGVTYVDYLEAYYGVYTDGSYRFDKSYSFGGSYKGINLPPPTKEDLLKLINDYAAIDPAQIFRSRSDEVSIDKIEVKDSSGLFWNTPRSISYNCELTYTCKNGSTEINQYFTRLDVIIKRETLKSPWKVTQSDEDYDNRQLLVKREVTNEVSANTMELQYVNDEKATKLLLQQAGYDPELKYTDPQKLAKDVYAKLFTLSREQFKTYLISVASPSWKNGGCKYSMSGQGQNWQEDEANNFYTRWAPFSNEYCPNPEMAPSDDPAYVAFYNKDKSTYTYFQIEKVGDYYYFKYSLPNLSENADKAAILKGINCGGVSSSNTSSSSTASTSSNPYKVGDKVQAQWQGTWYPCTVLAVSTDKCKLHWEGFADSYDSWELVTNLKK